VLREITGQKRNRLYRFDELVALFERQITPIVNDVDRAKSES
jgi:hypothetical protein